MPKEKKELTFEKRVELLLQSIETDRKKSKEEWKKSKEEWNEIKEQMKETDKKIKEVAKHIFGISRSNGMVAEEMIHNSLEKDKTFAGIRFDTIANNLQVRTADFQPKTDIDVLMVNGDTIAIIEVKYKVEKDDITELVNNKIHLFRQYYPRYSNHKIVLGIAGMSFESGVLQTANKKGVGIIKVVGDKVEYHTENVKHY